MNVQESYKLHLDQICTDLIDKELQVQVQVI